MSVAAPQGRPATVAYCAIGSYGATSISSRVYVFGLIIFCRDNGRFAGVNRAGLVNYAAAGEGAGIAVRWPGISPSDWGILRAYARPNQALSR